MSGNEPINVDPDSLHRGAAALQQFAQVLQPLGERLKNTGQKVLNAARSDGDSGVGQAVEEGTGAGVETVGTVFDEAGRVVGKAGEHLHTHADNYAGVDQAAADAFTKVHQGTDGEPSTAVAAADSTTPPGADPAAAEWWEGRGRQTPAPQTSDLAGRPGFSMMNPRDPFHVNAQNVPGIPGTYDVVAHGTPTGMQMAADRSMLSPRNVADMIRARPDYQEGMPVRLLSCNTGADVDHDFALQLARQLGAPVMAPEGYLYARADGRMGVSPTIPDTTPVTRMTGGFSRYSPGGFLEPNLPRDVWEHTP